MSLGRGFPGVVGLLVGGLHLVVAVAIVPRVSQFGMLCARPSMRATVIPGRWQGCSHSTACTSSLPS